MEDIKETAWDHVSGEKFATICSSEKKYIKKINDLHDKYPKDVDIRVQNDDGSIVARLPVDWLRIKPKKQTSMTPEQKAAAKARLEVARLKRLDDLKNGGHDN